ncbi:PLP-dependent aminotransferase family protein [Erwinia sp. V71]|uniref:MocR-like pyridoxine biosynthesis transcription factor PdxR n=1 Tax=Erwinia sp. V71 TaxID=3369424 RepID=UPI003F61FDF7
MAIMTTPLIALFASQQGHTRRERLSATLRQAIADGTLQQGQRLPSSRLMAQDLGLSRVTVEAAYSQLESEGYLQRKIGRGTFVAIAMPSAAKRADNTPLPVTLSARGQQIVATGGCFDPLFPQAFAAGSAELRAFPHALWRRISASQQRHHGEQLMRYGDAQGYAPLRTAVARYLAQSRGVQCDAAQVMILTSSQQALQMLSLLLLDSGDTVWMEEPGYSGARNAFISTGARLFPLTLDLEGAQLPTDAVPAVPKLVYLTPSHQYPTGVTMSLPRRLAWLRQATRQGSWLIEDDYDSEFYYGEQPMPALQGLAQDARVIYLGTFSKVLFPSLRLAYLVAPPALIEPLRRLRSVMDGHSAQLPQAITAEFIEQGHFAAHLRLMRQLYRSRRDILLAQLEEKLTEYLQPLSSQGGLQLTVRLLQGDEQRLTQQALQRGLLLPRLSPLFSQQQQTLSGWLLGFSALTPAEIVQAVDKLAQLDYD